jgi:hypothetical protein
MGRPRKLGRPKKRGPKSGPTKWTIEELVALAHAAENALQARDGTWSDRGNVKPILKAEWVQTRPKRIRAKWIAEWIKAQEEKEGEKYIWLEGKNYPRAEWLRQVLKRLDDPRVREAMSKYLLGKDKK